MAKVPDTPENMSRCLCAGCPSFPGSGGFFCAKGKSDSEIRKRGCLCTDCANFREFSLVDGYYCAAGAAGEGAQ
ncbi:MAG: DUF2769 domain-containing protein [Actinobacteria bacterium]|nr:DUF2769 domain-containing protein [Actinomycetota bacterium]